MTNPAGIRRRVDSRPPIRLAGPAARRDILVLPTRQRRRLLDSDHVILQPEIGIDILLSLEMAGDDSGAVGEGQDGAVNGECVFEAGEDCVAEVLEVLGVGFADFAQQQAFEARHPLAVIDAHLREEPMRLPTATRATVADGRRPVRRITQPRRGRRRELAGLQDAVGAFEVGHLRFGAAGEASGAKISFPLSHKHGKRKTNRRKQREQRTQIRQKNGGKKMRGKRTEALTPAPSPIRWARGSKIGDAVERIPTRGGRGGGRGRGGLIIGAAPWVCQ